MKNKVINGITVSLDANVAQVRLQSPLALAEIHAADGLKDRIEAIGKASQWSIVPPTQKNDNFNFSRAADVLPHADDYISVNFRALSKAVVGGHWIDWSKDNVLKDSLQKLLGATVYPNHDFTDINNWLGSVARVEWDDAGEKSDGVAGINAEYKIDALMNPRVARGLLMTPPAIHSTSMTVLFKFEFSHPEIAAENRWRFFELLGEEVEGHVVRLVVTEILEYWEASLVFQGADRLAKQHRDPDTEDFADMSVKPAAIEPPANSNEEKTMKLTKEQKTKLGIEFDGEEVPETEIFKAAESFADRYAGVVDTANIAELTKRAEAGDKLVEQKRESVTKLAKLAELGAEIGDLDEVVSQSIADADADKLVKLESYYQKKATEKFPENRRSSAENSDETDATTKSQKADTVPIVGLHD